MPSMRRITLWLAALLVAGALAIWAGAVLGAERLVRPGEPAPEIRGGPWINSEPLSIERLRGRVVFVEFWTYG